MFQTPRQRSTRTRADVLQTRVQTVSVQSKDRKKRVRPVRNQVNPETTSLSCSQLLKAHTLTCLGPAWAGPYPYTSPAPPLLHLGNQGTTNGMSFVQPAHTNTVPGEMHPNIVQQEQLSRGARTKGKPPGSCAVGNHMKLPCL